MTTTVASPRARTTFSRLEHVLDLPNLIDIQKASFRWFLDEGLRETIDDISPIEDYTGSLAVEFGAYKFGDPAFGAQLLESLERDRRHEPRDRPAAVGHLEALARRGTSHPSARVLAELSDPDPLHVLQSSTSASVLCVFPSQALHCRPANKADSAGLPLRGRGHFRYPGGLRPCFAVHVFPLAVASSHRISKGGCIT